MTSVNGKLAHDFEQSTTVEAGSALSGEMAIKSANFRLVSDGRAEMEIGYAVSGKIGSAEGVVNGRVSRAVSELNIGGQEVPISVLIAALEAYVVSESTVEGVLKL